MNRKTYYPFLLIIVALAAYANSFNGPFLFDDTNKILENPVIRDLGNFTSHYAGPFYTPRRYVGYLSFALNYQVGGLDVRGYHVVNLLIHLLNALMLFLLVLLTFRTPFFRGQGSGLTGDSAQATRRGRMSEHFPLPPFDTSAVTDHQSRFIALFAALLFVSHPLQTQAVTYIVQRFTSLCTLFYLLSVILYIKGRLASVKSSAVLFFLLSLLSAVAAMKTKEIAFTLPLMILLYELSFFRVSLRKRLLFLLPLLLTLLIIPLSMMGTDKPVGELLSDLSEKTRVQTNISREDYLLTQARVVVTYIRLLFVPINQNLDYDYPIYRSLLTPAVLLSVILLLSLFCGGLYLYYASRTGARNSVQGAAPSSSALPLSDNLSLCYRLIGFGILWFFIALSVESSVIPIADVIFEHRVYLPSVGVFIAIATTVLLFMERLKRRMPWVERVMVVVLALSVLALVATTYARNTIWQSERSLWENVVKKSPNKSRPHNDLGYIYLHKGDIDRAIEHFQDAISLNPRYSDAHNNLGVAYYSRGQTDRAIEQFKISLTWERKVEDIADTHHNLGIAFTSKGMFDASLRELKSALELDSNNPQIYNDLGVALQGKGLIDESIASLKTALRLKPDYAMAHMNLGISYYRKGLHNRSRYHFSLAHELEPDIY